MKKIAWFERKFVFGLPQGMLPFLIERVEGTVVRLEKKVAGVSEEILSIKLDDKWSIKQNIGHLAEVDEVGVKRINEILHGISPMSPAVFEPKQDYNVQPIKQVLDYFRESRANNVRAYENVSDNDFEKYSLHPRLQLMMNIVDMALFRAEHDDHHLVRINEILATLKR